MVIGREIRTVDTPALWVDLDLMEGNIDRLSTYFNNAGVSWRPQLKSIKVPAIAHMMLGAGAIGVTCAKLSEAEVMAAAGIKDILIANQVVGPWKVKRLVALQRYAHVMPCVDNLENAREISVEADKSGVQVSILIEVDTGMNRCGVEPGEPVLALAKRIAKLPSVKLAGLMTWEGGRIAKISDIEEKRRLSQLALTPFVESAQLCREAGIEIPILNCGGTGTYMVSSHIEGVTEIQAGGGVFGCVAYREWGVDLDFALFVLATVISKPTPSRAIVDAGRKAMHIGVATPALRDMAGVKVSALHSEHGLLELADEDVQIRYGQKVNFIVGYSDYTVNLYDQIFAVRNGIVEATWDITARGKLT